MLGPDHPDTLASANNLAGDLWSLREYGAARELAEDTLARLRGVLGPDHPDTRDADRLLARILADIGGDQPGRES